jgi:hypothetical protein
MSHALRVALVALPLAVSACATTEDPPELEDTDVISFNGLAPETLPASAEALTALAGGPLDGATTELASSEAGQALLTDVVRCALPTGASASFRREGGPDLVFAGLLGLAPGWNDGPIGETDQRFVTACLMAHVNGRETPFPISVRSSRRNADLVEQLAFPAEEMAVYGNLFAPGREMIACFGEAVAQTLGSSGGISDALPNYLDFRFCSIDEECNFSLVGPCFRFPSSNVTTSACETRSRTIYDGCHARPIQEAPTPDINEAVTVYLQPADLALLLTEYTAVICETLGVCVDLDLDDLLGGLGLPL